MPLYLSWQQIALRLFLASLTGLVLGINRDEHGRPAGMRTTMLVTLAATLAMLQVNLLLPLAGKPQSSFNELDLMRLPLGILSGIGFIGAGTILKKGDTATGVTTAATIWFATVLGLLFGGGQLVLGVTGALIGLFILSALQRLESRVPRRHSGIVTLHFDDFSPAEHTIRDQVESAGCKIKSWTAEYVAANRLSLVRTEVSWRAPNAGDELLCPPKLDGLRSLPGLTGFRWQR